MTLCLLQSTSVNDEVYGNSLEGRPPCLASALFFQPFLCVELGLYPPSFLRRARLRRIVLAEGLAYKGQARKAVPVVETGTLYLDCKPEIVYYLQSVFHHEFFHMFDDKILAMLKGMRQLQKGETGKDDSNNNDDGDEYDDASSATDDWRGFAPPVNTSSATATEPALTLPDPLFAYATAACNARTANPPGRVPDFARFMVGQAATAQAQSQAALAQSQAAVAAHLQRQGDANGQASKFMTVAIQNQAVLYPNTLDTENVMTADVDRTAENVATNNVTVSMHLKGLAQPSRWYRRDVARNDRIYSQGNAAKSGTSSTKPDKPDAAAAKGEDAAVSAEAVAPRSTGARTSQRPRSSKAGDGAQSGDAALAPAAETAASPPKQSRTTPLPPPPQPPVTSGSRNVAAASPHSHHSAAGARGHPAWADEGDVWEKDGDNDAAATATANSHRNSTRSSRSSRPQGQLSSPPPVAQMTVGTRNNNNNNNSNASTRANMSHGNVVVGGRVNATGIPTAAAAAAANSGAGGRVVGRNKAAFMSDDAGINSEDDEEDAAYIAAAAIAAATQSAAADAENYLVSQGYLNHNTHNSHAHLSTPIEYTVEIETETEPMPLQPQPQQQQQQQLQQMTNSDVATQRRSSNSQSRTRAPAAAAHGQAATVSTSHSHSHSHAHGHSELHSLALTVPATPASPTVSPLSPTLPPADTGGNSAAGPDTTQTDHANAAAATAAPSESSSLSPAANASATGTVETATTSTLTVSLAVTPAAPGVPLAESLAFPVPLIPVLAAHRSAAVRLWLRPLDSASDCGRNPESVGTDPLWHCLNPPGFRYGDGGAQDRDGTATISPHSEVDIGVGTAFLNRYSMAAIEEDKAEVYAGLMRHSAALLKYVTRASHAAQMHNCAFELVHIEREK